jgi:hypothetical protein
MLAVIMLSVTNKPFMLIVVAPNLQPSKKKNIVVALLE